MAWRLEELNSCPDCGTSRWEWDPAQGGHRQAYQTKTWLCPVCMMAEPGYRDIHKNGQPGTKLSIEPTIYHPTLTPAKKLSR